MITRNGYEEFVLGLLEAQLVDCATYYPELSLEFRRDFSRLSSALKCHGIMFVLDTMPAYRKHLDRCLAMRRLTSFRAFHFGSYERGGTIPRLFRGLFLRVFESTGALKLDPDLTAVRLLRQLLGVCRRIRLEATPKGRFAAFSEFYRIDQEVRYGTLNWATSRRFDLSTTSKLRFTEACWSEENGSTAQGLLDYGDPTPVFSQYAGVLEHIQRTADMLSACLGVFNPSDWKFRHGPGAVSDQRFEAYKYAFTNWPDRLDAEFPYSEFAVANYGVLEPSRSEEVIESGFLREPPAQLLAVPKTIKTPRLIASEPTSFQWCQQSIKDYFYRRVHDTFISQFISFTDQTRNGALALQASLRATHATIDLSSASDRISCWHVERLFRRLPCLLSALKAVRSQTIKQKEYGSLPNVHALRKFSTMGNATIFPVQSLFFLCVALGSTLYQRGLPVSLREIRKLGSEQVRVFGDDIIVPDDCSGLVVDTLQYLGLKVNPNKTFTEGNFRESCGVDAFLGHDVTTVSVLDVPKRTSPGSIVSSVDVHRNLCERGFPATARYIRKTVTRNVRTPIRSVRHGSGAFGWSDLYGDEPDGCKTRWNKSLHRLEVYCLNPKVKNTRVLPEDSAGLLQFFTEAAEVVTSSVSSIGHLSRRPQAKVSLGWVSVTH